MLTSEDHHGRPALTSDHGVCAGSTAGGPSGRANAYDWGFCWKVFDALRSCAYAGTSCRYALGNTPAHRYLGTWSDGVPIIGLKVQHRAHPRRARPPAPARSACDPATRRTTVGRDGDRREGPDDRPAARPTKERA